MKIYFLFLIRNTSRSDFKFYADRLIRLVIEESLNQLPYSDCSVATPTGAIYDGLKYRSGNCGVSIVRSGEAMEQVKFWIAFRDILTIMFEYFENFRAFGTVVDQ